MKQTNLLSFPHILSIMLIFFFTTLKLNAQSNPILPGAERPDLYLDLLKGKSVGIVANQTSILPQDGNKHVVDYLLDQGVALKKVFVPEHGFRGDVDAGAEVNSSVDSKTGLPIVSLYGNNKKPSASQISDLDIIIFDLQDVGVRFYTYISTMHYVMEAASENGKQVIIFDRPNPNGDYIDGPVLKKGFESFVGMHPIPVVHGLTVGELAQMINGEKWLKGGLTCQLEVIPVANWNHKTPYQLPVKPSPNLPNDLSIRLYPSTCFFEGSVFSLGRGTTFPFQVYGYPDQKMGTFSFTPVSIPGMSTNPPYKDQICYGVDLRNESMSHRFTIQYIIDALAKSGKGESFFKGYFNTLAGTDVLKKQLLAGKDEEEIRKSWQDDLKNYKTKRSKYLIYKD